MPATTMQESQHAPPVPKQYCPPIRTASHVQHMKLLSFEIAARVERRECPRCRGTGFHWAGPCFTCGGWAYLPTTTGRELLTSAAALIGGNAAFDSKARFDDIIIRHLFGHQLRAGMSVHPMANLPWRAEGNLIIASVEPRPKYGYLVTFTNGDRVSTTDLESWSRELTEDENLRANHWIAQFVGRGAVRA